MEMKKVKKVQILIIILCILLGTLLHFTYEWSGENVIIGSFSAVNESIWEHLKLAFFPMFIFGILQFFLLPKTDNLIKAKTLGIITATSFIIVFFYTYVGIIGRNFLVIDIFSFIISILLGEWVTYRFLQKRGKKPQQIVYGILLLVILGSFFLFTYRPPHIGLFQDPVNQSYGIYKQK